MLIKYGFRPMFRYIPDGTPPGGTTPDAGTGDQTAKVFSQADLSSKIGSVRAEERGKWQEKLDQATAREADLKKQIADRENALKEREIKLTELGKLAEDGKAAVTEVNRLKLNQKLMAKGAHPEKVDDLRLLLEHSGSLAKKEDGKEPDLDEVMKSAREKYGTAFFTDPSTARTPNNNPSGKTPPGSGDSKDKPIWERARS